MNDPKRPNLGGAANASAASATSATSPTSPTEKRTLVEDGTKFKGALSSTCPIHVQGAIEGTVEGPALTVSATGVVSGKVTATSLKSEGKVSGEFEVETANLAGTVGHNTVVVASALDVKLEAQSGKLQLTFGQPDASRRRS